MATPFLETPRFPDDLSFWAKGGVAYNTVVSGSTSGRETRNSLWQYGRGQWSLSNAGRTSNPNDAYNVQQLRNFFRVMKGQAYGFRFRDWTDFKDEGNGILGAPVVSLTQPIAPTGTGLGLPVYQMFKKYVLSPLADYRLIQKPVSGTVAVLLNGVAWPGTLDYATGLFTPSGGPAASQNISSYAVGGTSTVLTLAAPISGLTIGMMVYVRPTGSGTINAKLGGHSWPVTNISGNDVTITAATTGLTGTLSVADRYAGQPADTVTWTGQFDTPCRFMQDDFDAYFDPQGLYSINMNFVELRLEF